MINMRSAIKHALRGTALALALTAMLAPVASGVEASAKSGGERARTVRVVRDGDEYRGKIHFRGGITYVGLREFSEQLGASVDWDGPSRCASAKTSALSLSAVIGEHCISANGRSICSSGATYLENGRTYVPLRSIGSAFGFDVTWSPSDFSAHLSRHREAIEGYDTDALYWLSRIIYAEARGEPMAGKLAVGSVVMNRVASSEFPGTVYGVVFDRRGGVQFTPVANGEIYRTPDSESIEAAKRCLDGERTSGDILFFINADIASSFWICENRQYVMSVGNHDFYA